MAHIGNRAEYGLHCLLYLIDRGENEAPSASDLAVFQGVSVSYLAKLFTQLEKAGLVESIEGIGGGFRLARPARDISVLEIVDALEGRKPLFVCRDIRRNCALYAGTPPAAATSGICSIHAVMREAEGAMRASLAGHTLADIAERVSAKIPERFRKETGAWFAARAGGRRRRNAKT